MLVSEESEILELEMSDEGDFLKPCLGWLDTPTAILTAMSSL